MKYKPSNERKTIVSKLYCESGAFIEFVFIESIFITIYLVLGAIAKT